MQWRALLAFLVLPGIVAFAIPFALIADRLACFSPRTGAALAVLSGLVWQRLR